jgi:ribose transport system substrate-binding protein
LRIAIFTKNLINPAYEGARLGADRAAKTFGAATVHFVPKKPDDPEEQASLIEEALSSQIDAFVLVPTHPTAINESIREINARGIPLVAFVNRLTEGQCVSFVSSDDYQMAFEIASHVYGHLGGTGEIVIVEGPANSVTSIPRVSAFRDAALDHAGINIVSSCQGAFLRDPAKEAMIQVLEQTPRVDAVLAANDSMALGVLDALDAAGRTASVAGINAIPEAIEAIKKGRMTATADFNAMNMAYIATECVLRHLRGETVPNEIMLPARIVDRDNCGLWDMGFAERASPSWHDVT